MGTIQALLRDPVKRGRYESRVAAFVDTICTCNLNAVPAKRLTVELCCAGDPCHDLLEVKNEGVWVKQSPSTALIGRQVRVSSQQTSKCKREIEGRFKAVHPDGWYEVTRASLDPSRREALDTRIRGTDVDYTVVKTSTAAGIPFSEGRCALAPKVSIATRDEPAFGASFLARAAAYVGVNHANCTACEEANTTGRGTAKVCVHCVHCGSTHARRRGQVPSNSCADCEGEILRLQEKQGGGAESWACVVCKCTDQTTHQAGKSSSRSRQEYDDNMCPGCRAETTSFMQPLLGELGGLVVGSLQHGKRVKVENIGDGSMTRVTHRRCLRCVY